MGNSSSTNDDPKMEYMSWKIPFVAGLVSTLFFFYMLIYVKDHLIRNINNPIFDEMYNIFVFLILFNIIIATYTVTLYYYRINKPGMKGPKGKYGKRGKSGIDSKCDIFTSKNKTFSLNQDIKLKPYNVDTSKTEDISKFTVDVDNNIKEPKWTRMYTNENNTIKDNYLGSKYTSCLKDDKCSTEGSENINAAENSFKPFTGALSNYDLSNNKLKGNVNTLQFLASSDSNNSDHSVLVAQKFGIEENRGISDNFKCPSNSAIYKIETVHDEDRQTDNGIEYGTIKGITFHCKDIDTGNPVKILDSENNKVDSVTFGVQTNQNNPELVYNSVECGNKDIDGKTLPGFMSNYTALQSKDKGISTIAINQCSYYDKNQR